MKPFESLQKNIISESVENKTEKEFTIENKGEVASAWREIVLGGGEVPEEVEKMSNAEFKSWLSESLTIEVDKILKEWGVEADSDLLAEIKNAKNEEELAEAQISYLKSCHEKIDELVSKFSQGGHANRKSRRWDSWPLTMRENKAFNCVGASLLGQRLLEKANLENYFGNPAGHVINVAKLADEQWWYADFLNGKRSFKKIEAQEIEISGTPALKLEDEIIEYRYVLLHKKEFAISYILGNLHSLVHESHLDEIPDDDPGKIIAKELFARFENIFKSIDFGDLEAGLFLEENLGKSSVEMRRERDRIKRLYKVYEEVFPLVREKYSINDWKSIMQEYKSNFESVKLFFYENNEEILNKVSDNLRNVLLEYKKRLAPLKESDMETYQEIIGKML